LLAAASENGTVQVWDVGTRQEVRSFTGLKNRVRSLAFSPDGKRLAGASLPDFGAGQVKIWEVDSGRETGSCNGVYPPVNGLRFSPDGNRLAAFGSQDMLKILDGTSGAELVLVSGRGVHAWLGGRLATAAPGAVLLWDAGLGQPRATLAGLP
jgi:WD40 repeat protein